MAEIAMMKKKKNDIDEMIKELLKKSISLQKKILKAEKIIDNDDEMSEEEASNYIIGKYSVVNKRDL